ncbi:16057_t:CDS:2 [Funneliformis geosporum]|uniref:16057_t:CDS:1 n=1 Tax=Funneliformis geosporum TaxID=1117311 RepID=A0A9W4SY44_9GLOM|nr:16057_t:CDS:2 [Funneliformis geosporum]
MLLCEFRGDMIALKSVDLSKAPSYVLEEMKKEVEIYKDLAFADIQGKYIPKLICHGYYGGEAIHKHGILHNDIREENILINDNG